MEMLHSCKNSSDDRRKYNSKSKTKNSILLIIEKKG